MPPSQHPPRICLPDGTWLIDTEQNRERARALWSQDNENNSVNEDDSENEDDSVNEGSSVNELEDNSVNEDNINKDVNYSVDELEDSNMNKDVSENENDSVDEAQREREQDDEIKMHKESLGKMRTAHERRQQRALKKRQRRDQRARTGRDNRERQSGLFVSDNMFGVLATTDFAGVSSSGAGSNSDSHSGSTEQKTVTAQNAWDDQTSTGQSAITEQDGSAD